MGDGKLNEINDLIHAKVRLGIMSMVMTYEQCDFSQLKKQLGLTDGNLGTHIRRLEEAGYIHVKKTFINRKPKTYIRVTETGAAAYREYIAALEAILNADHLEHED